MTMAQHRVKFAKFDEHIRLPGLEMRDYFRAPQFEERTGKFALLDDVHMVLNDQTGIITITKGQHDPWMVHISRAWGVKVFGSAEEVKDVDAEIAALRKAQAAAKEARRTA